MSYELRLLISMIVGMYKGEKVYKRMYQFCNKENYTIKKLL